MSDTITMYRGDKKVFTVTITDEGGSPVNCSTATAIKATCRSTVGGSQLFQCTLAAGEIAVGGAGNNVITVTIGPSKTTGLTAAQDGTTYLLDVEVTFSATDIQTFPRDVAGVPALIDLVIYGDITT